MYHVGNVVVLRERERGGWKPGTSVLLDYSSKCYHREPALFFHRVTDE